MKRVFKYFAYAFCATMILAGCDDIVTYNDGYDDGTTPLGPPLIEKVTPVDDPDDLLTGGSFNQMVAIHGENLAGVTSILVNDQPVDLREIYAVNSRIIMTIPETVPNEIDNKIKLTTTKGNDEIDFKVSFPDLVITGMSNEFAKAGEVLEIVGENLRLYNFTPENGILTVDGKPAAIMDAQDGKITFVVPQGVSDNSKIVITSDRFQSVTGKDKVELPFRDPGYPVMDMMSDNYPIWAKTSDAVSGVELNFSTKGTNAGDPSPIVEGGYFSRFNYTVQGYKWNYIIFQNNYQFNLPQSNSLCTDIVANQADYDFVYEHLVSPGKPINNVNHRIMVFLGRRPADAAKEWLPGASGTVYHTDGKWRTKRMNGQDYMNPPVSGGPWTTSLKENGNPFGFCFISGGGTDMVQDCSFGNFRICKKITQRIPQQ